MKSVATIVVLAFCAALEVSATTPVTFDDLVNRAAIARSQNEFPQAIALYSQALLIRPKWEEGWFVLGLLKYQTGSYVAARDDLSRFMALSLHPEQALGIRGLCEFQLGEYAKSLKDIQRALLASPEPGREEEVLRYHEAMLLTRLGRYEEALGAYAWFTKKQLPNTDILQGIGLAGLRLPVLPGDLSQNTQRVEATGRAIVQFMRGDTDGSRRQFEELFRRFPAPNEHYTYGLLLFASGSSDAGIKEFVRESELYSANGEGQIMAAWALLMKKDPEGALPYASRAAAESPNSAKAQLVFGRALSETGRASEGVKHLSQALRISPDNLEIHIALAEAYSRAGDRAQSQRERRICLRMTNDGKNRVALP